MGHPQLTSLNSIKLATGANYRFSQTSLGLISSSSGKYFLVNGMSESPSKFTSNITNYDGVNVSISDSSGWVLTIPTQFACFYLDGNNNSTLDSGEQLGFTFQSSINIESETITISELHNATNNYQYILFSLDDVATKTVFFSFYDSSDNKINTAMGYVTNPKTGDTPCSLPDNQSVYLIQIPPSTDLTKIEIKFVGDYGISDGVSFVGTISSPLDYFTTNFPCFLDGTMILTENGEINISDLNPGDKLLNADGNLVTVEHIWTRDVFNINDKNKYNAYPNLIPKDYFDKNKPNKDLYISPQHKILYKDVMVDSQLLDVEQQYLQVPFRYYNLTLVEGYGTMIANGCVVETYKRKENVAIEDEKGMILYR